tara:strand:- start:469 stop:624 length:156 start_codon:yes stop_codon:yes gene_type:complete
VETHHLALPDDARRTATATTRVKIIDTVNKPKANTIKAILISEFYKTGFEL